MKIDINNELKLLDNKVSKLEKKDIEIIISDFDDTIFCRNEQLEKSELLRTNRWNAWNDIILSTIGLENYINEFYKWKKFPNDIVSKMNKNHDLILTAWYKVLQDAKLTATNLIDKLNYIVVEKAENKILETIRYVVEDLWFIPSKITVYEDRPNYFIDNKDIIEKYLNTKLEVFFVEMIDNYTSPKTKKVA